jgi:asparagine synthase (glutamine-hydrolysing)
MCGITGLVNVASARLQDVDAMIQTIRYRGVDEYGVKDLGPVLLGHTRLAVVDPENGHQPMTNIDDSVWVTFNGEIYNFVELREELKAKGYHFKSRCDTEVLVHLWREEGEAMLDRLIGMFAFFVWDAKTKRGMLARDRQGIKPCFIADYKGGLAFASEMKAILALPDFPKEMNLAGLKEVFSFNYCLPPHTCFKGIAHLEPGTYMLFEADKKPVTKRYWQWAFGAQERVTPCAEEFSALIDDAVRMQMRFDVDGGLYLSGGVDSSVVAKHLSKQWNRPVMDAVGLDFSDPQFSEYQHSELAASLVGNIALERACITPQMIPQLADNVVYHAEQPHGDFSFFLFYTLAKGANAQGKIVMFTGDGPDETMAGFGHNERYFHSLTRMNFSLRQYFDIICYMDAEKRQLLLNPDFESSTPDPYDTFAQAIEPWQDLEPIEQIMAYECTKLMPGNNLVKGDRMGAGWSTEGRAPLMDHRICDMFTKLPVNQKFRDGYGKYFFKNYATEHFPKDFIFKEKGMPTTPIGEWIKAPLYDWAREVLSFDNAYCINSKNAVALLDDHKAGKGNYTRELRTLIMTQLWLRKFFN